MPTYQFRSEVDAESSLVQSIGLVLQGQPRVGQRVVVLSTTVWSQVLFLPAMSVQGISREELAEALKFEAETLSGLEIDDIAISFLAGERSEDQQKYWVSVFSQIELTLLTQSIQNAGGRVVQVMHPAGAGRLKPTWVNARLNSGIEVVSFLKPGNESLVVYKSAMTSPFAIRKRS